MHYTCCCYLTTRSKTQFNVDDWLAHGLSGAGVKRVHFKKMRSATGHCLLEGAVSTETAANTNLAAKFQAAYQDALFVLATDDPMVSLCLCEADDALIITYTLCRFGMVRARQKVG
jgi:hypothetical protein